MRCCNLRKLQTPGRKHYIDQRKEEAVEGETGSHARQLAVYRKDSFTEEAVEVAAGKQSHVRQSECNHSQPCRRRP